MHFLRARCNSMVVFVIMFVSDTNIFFFIPIGGHLIRRPLATTRARSGDLFIIRAPDRQVTVSPYEGTDSFTSMSSGIRTRDLRCSDTNITFCITSGLNILHKVNKVFKFMLWFTCYNFLFLLSSWVKFRNLKQKICFYTYAFKLYTSHK